MTERAGDFQGNIFDISALFLWLFENLAKPVTSTIGLLMKSGFVGFTITFALFFILLLSRQAAGAKNTAVFGALIGSIGRQGVFWTGLYLCILTVEYLFLPFLTVFFGTVWNSVSGGHPNLGEMISLVLGSGEPHNQFIKDFSKFYNSNRLILPIGFNLTILILVSFASMVGVSEAIKKMSFLNSPPMDS